MILDSKDEIYLEVNSLSSHFYGNWQWETEDKNWITWNGGSYEDQHATYAKFDFTTGELHYIGASFAATSASAGTLIQGETTIAVNNGTDSSIDVLHKLDAEWVKDETKMENVTILAILSAKNTTTNQLLPISMTSEPATGITHVKALNPTESIYNLMGVRMNQVKRGLNIVNRQKVMVK